MKNLKAIQKHWREEFEKEWNKLYPPKTSFASIILDKGKKMFLKQLDTAIAGVVKEVLEGVEDTIKNANVWQIGADEMVMSEKNVKKLAKIIINSLQDIEEKGKI